MDAGLKDPSRAPVAPDQPFRRGDAIDRFTVLEPLGMGGMGIVVSAYDCDLDRKVAIKVLRPDRVALEPEQGRTRLLREAQAMARLSHPNVVTVHEVGTVGEQVFVAMELVSGQTLAEWLAEPRSWRDIADVLSRAGRGLAAAHRAGLVHRDFKPDNVLLGAGGEVRVTDFGLAGVAADSPARDDATMLSAPLTRTGAVMGTPAYMSPEQHRGEEADARSDQFSFCVALHEALYGVRPFAGENGAELLDAIEARRLSAPVREAPRWLRPLVLRGLEPRREDRWPGMDALLDALSRDPAVRRRRWLLGGGAAAVIAAVAAGFILTGERPALCQGARAQAQAMWNASSRDRVRAAFMATGSPIAAGVFDRVDRQLGARLDGWAAAHTEACQATHERGEQSEAMLDLRMQCLSRARRQIGALVDVWTREPVKLEKAIDAAAGVGDVAGCADTEALAMPVAPPRDPALAQRIERIRAQLDSVQAQQRAGQLTGALALAREAVAAARPLRHPPILAEALYRNGQLECMGGDKGVGFPLLYDAVRVSADAHDDVLSATILNTLVIQLSDDRRMDEASTVARFARAAVARAGDRDELVAGQLRGQSSLFYAQGDYEKALDSHRRARAIQEKQLGAEHPLVVQLGQGEATDLRMLGRFAEAEEIMRRTLAIQERTLGPVHHLVATTLNNLFGILAEQGKLDEASPLAERALAIREQVYPPGHPMTASSLHNLAWIAQSQGRLEEARSLYQRAEKMRAAALGPDHPDTTKSRLNLGLMDVERGDTASGRRLIESVIAARTKAVGAQHPTVAGALTYLGDAFVRDRNWKAAEAALARSLAIWRKQDGVPPELAEALRGMGLVRLGQKRHAEAVALLEEAVKVTEQGAGEQSTYLDDILVALGDAYLAARRTADAVRTLERAVALSETLGDDGSAPVFRFHLARALWVSGRRARAIDIARAARDAMSGRDARHERERGLALASRPRRQGGSRAPLIGPARGSISRALARSRPRPPGGPGPPRRRRAGAPPSSWRRARRWRRSRRWPRGGGNTADGRRR